MIGSTVLYQSKKPPAVARLSLVSLMDIFTILVFFLLLNSGDSQEIENAKFVNLPDSASGVQPHTELNISVTETEILLGDEVVATIADVKASSERLIEPLAEALKANTERLGDISEYEQNRGLAVTIMGDKNVSYALLRQVMSTCQYSNYRNISLAVNQVQVSAGAETLPEGLEREDSEAEIDVVDSVSQVGQGD